MHSPILILGGGFAGVRTALSLAKRGIRCTLIDRNDGLDYHHDLYEVAASPLPPAEVRQLYQHVEHFTHASIFAGKPVAVVKATVQTIELKKNSVATSEGPFTYDTLVVALGGRPADFTVPGAHEFPLHLWSLQDAYELHDRLFELSRKGRACPNGSAGRVVIFGGGFMGCELAAELALHRGENRLSITIIEAMPHVLSGIEPLASEAQKRLRSLAIDVKLSSPVTVIEEKNATLASGEKIPYDLAIWCGGVMGHPLLGTLNVPLSKGGFVSVDDHLRIPGHQNAYCIGDSASCLDTTSGKPYPKLASIALVMGEHVAAMIASLKNGTTPEPFHTHPGPIAVPLGGAYALVLQKVAGLAEGLPGWVVRRGLDLDLLQELFPQETSYEILQEQEEAYEGVPQTSRLALYRP